MSTITAHVSVLIRTRDLESHFHKLLQSLSRQTLHPFELVIVDNYSNINKLKEMTDLLTNVKKEFFGGLINLLVVPLTDEEFSHAYSTNAGVSVASGDLICITNGHCLPTSDKWLESAVAHFKVRDIAGVSGYTLPHKQGTIWEKLAFDWSWRRPNEASRAYYKDTYFSTTNCIIRRLFWEEYPFDEKLPELIPEAGRFGGEDYDWSLEMLARGYKLIVEPKFDVYHSHGETVSQLAPKYFAWRKIRRILRSLVRPRESFTLFRERLPIYNII